MRVYRVLRLRDVSGNTGTGHVADVTEFDNGRAVISFRDEPCSVAVYDRLADLERVHGHGGHTVLELLVDTATLAGAAP